MAIPDANGELHATYQNPPPAHGAPLNIIDPATGSPGGGQAEVSWSVAGPPGAQGPQGIAGSQGVAGTPGPQGPPGSSPDLRPLYLNQSVLVDDVSFIFITAGNNDPDYYVYTNTNMLLGRYAPGTASNAQTALSAFLNTVGESWVSVGTLSDITPYGGTRGASAIVAVNLARVGFELVDGGTGITVAGFAGPSFGYAPWDTYVNAAAAIGTLVGNVTRNVNWSPSS